jgi:hypothetical protein
MREWQIAFVRRCVSGIGEIEGRLRVDFGRRNPSAFRLHTKKRTPGYPGVCLTVFQQLRDFSLSSAALFHLSGTLFTFCGTRHRHDALAKIG